MVPLNFPSNRYLESPLPIGSMYGIYTNIGDIVMVNVTIYSSTMDPLGYGNGSFVTPCAAAPALSRDIAMFRATEKDRTPTSDDQDRLMIG